MTRMLHSNPLCLVCAAALSTVTGCKADPAGPGQSPYAGVLYINEFMASNASVVADEKGDFDDWVELYNAGTTDVELGAMFLTDDLSQPMKWGFSDTFVPAGGYLLVWCDGEYDEGWMHTSFKLNAGPGEQLGLFSTDGEHVFAVDTLSFGPQSSDTSYGRLPDGGDWQLMPNPTPGMANVSHVSPLRGTLFINEFLAANDSVLADEAGDYDDWVELYNAGHSELDLSGLFLTDNLAAPAKWPFPDTSIPARGFLLVWADTEENEGKLHANFNLGAAVGEQLGLFAAGSGQSLIVDTLSFGPQAVDTSSGRAPDGSTKWRLFPTPTPGKPNSGPSGP